MPMTMCPFPPPCTGWGQPLQGILPFPKEFASNLWPIDHAISKECWHRVYPWSEAGQVANMNLKVTDTQVARATAFRHGRFSTEGTEQNLDSETILLKSDCQQVARVYLVEAPAGRSGGGPVLHTVSGRSLVIWLSCQLRLHSEKSLGNQPITPQNPELSSF